MLRNIFSFALVVMLTVLFANNIQAQTLANANLPTSANVMAALSITNHASLAFGNVGQGVTAVINPTGSGHSYVGSTATVGKFTIHGANNTPVLISWPATLALYDAVSHLNDITITFNVNGDKLVANQGSPASPSMTSGNPYTTALVGDVNPGDFYLWVGGSLPTGANSGNFTGSANFTAEYQ